MRIHDVGVARQIGPCSDAIERSPGSRMLLVTYRTPGIRPDRSSPERIEAQAEQAWANVRAALARANKTLRNLVKICSAKICQHVRQCLGYPGSCRSARMRARALAPNLDVVPLNCTCSATSPNGVEAMAADAPLG
jgi:hypothetical protein